MQEITVPIRLDGTVRGRLTVTQEGLLTLFSARCEDPGHLVRLSVYGDGREGYLGVMVPDGTGGLKLVKKLSRGELRRFPEKLEYASEEGAAPQTVPKPTEKKEPAASPPERTQKIPGAAPGLTENTDRTGGEEPSRRPASPPTEESETELLWYQTGDGSLFTTYRGRSFRAIPMSAWGLPSERILEKRHIDGVEYAVFELKNGKII